MKTKLLLPILLLTTSFAYSQDKEYVSSLRVTFREMPDSAFEFRIFIIVPFDSTTDTAPRPKNINM